jgi:hypothetical protein
MSFCKWILGAMILLALTNCDQNLKHPEISNPIVNNSVNIKLVAADGSSISEERYSNANKLNTFTCAWDSNLPGVMILAGRIFVPSKEGVILSQFISFRFVPDTRTGELNVANWNQNTVQLNGRLIRPSLYELGGKLTGTCKGRLSFQNSKLEGNTYCADFVDSSSQGLGAYSVEITNLNCWVN